MAKKNSSAATNQAAPRATRRKKGAGSNSSNAAAIARNVKAILSNTKEIIKLLKVGTGPGTNPGPVPPDVASVRKLIDEKIAALKAIEQSLEDKFVSEPPGVTKNRLANLKRHRSGLVSEFEDIKDDKIRAKANQGASVLAEFRDDIAHRAEAMLKAIAEA